jgi:hypothetical protein
MEIKCFIVDLKKVVPKETIDPKLIYNAVVYKRLPMKALVGPLKKKTPKLLNGRPEGHEIWDEYV